MEAEVLYEYCKVGWMASRAVVPKLVDCSPIPWEALASVPLMGGGGRQQHDPQVHAAALLRSPQGNPSHRMCLKHDCNPLPVSRSQTKSRLQLCLNTFCNLGSPAGGSLHSPDTSTARGMSRKSPVGQGSSAILRIRLLPFPCPHQDLCGSLLKLENHYSSGISICEKSLEDKG